jgi:formylglycine-generating enzyme required for sulfatase activity
MAGNVWEWVDAEQPPGERVLRGGSYASPGLTWLRCAMRSHSRPERRQAHIGFRIARGDAHAR